MEIAKGEVWVAHIITVLICMGNGIACDYFGTEVVVEAGDCEGETENFNIASWTLRHMEGHGYG